MPGEVTSQAGWPPDTPVAALQRTSRALRRHDIRVSIFVDPDPDASAGRRHWTPIASSLHRAVCTRVRRGRPRARGELRDATPRQRRSRTRFGLGINAGHDLDLDNLSSSGTLPHLDEVSIGHALISHALYVGLERAVKDYLAVLAG